MSLLRRVTFRLVTALVAVVAVPVSLRLAVSLSTTESVALSVIDSVSGTANSEPRSRMTACPICPMSMASTGWYIPSTRLLAVSYCQQETNAVGVQLSPAGGSVASGKSALPGGSARHGTPPSRPWRHRQVLVA